MTSATPSPFIISREFDAPRALVFQAWSDVQHLAQWFGPKGFSITQCNLDFRTGGIFHYCLRGPGGNEMWGKWVFRAIEPPERIEMVNSFSDAQGNLTRHPMSDTWPLEMLSTATFTERAGKTTLSVQWQVLDDATEAERTTFDGARAGMTQGWNGTMDQLADYLANVQE